MMGLRERLIKQKEKEQKAIPSKVFYNHFFAINYHIESDLEKYDLKKIQYYNQLKLNNAEFDIEQCRKLLWNAWSTEYAFNLASHAGNDDFYRFALHWHFPQAYYSIYLAMTAFHETQGIANEQHEKSIKLFGNSIRNSHYPKAISFYAEGLFKEFKFQGLDLTTEVPKDFKSLTRIDSCEDAQNQIASFLKTTRKQNAQNKRVRGKKSHAKDKRFQNGKGELRKNFSKKQWDIIYQSIPETSLLNVMYRLRIKANYQDIETFVNADINFPEFHNCLGNIISYLNFVHEAYLHKIIGTDKYEKILFDFGSNKLDVFAKNRYEELIKKI